MGGDLIEGVVSGIGCLYVCYYVKEVDNIIINYYSRLLIFL